MSGKSDSLWDLAIPLPISESFRRQARDYADQYFVLTVQTRIYFNTLAVLVCDAYLRLLGFETDLTNPARWNAPRRLWSQASELELPGLGAFECCGIAIDQETIALPIEDEFDRIGYLFVEIASSEKSALLIGFLPDLQSEAIAIEDLQSIDAMIDHLAQREASLKHSSMTDLKRWLEDIYAAGWEPAMRSLETTTGKKKLHLAGQTFEIRLAVAQNEDQLMLVRVIVQGENTLLPSGMKVSVPDETDIYTETVAQAADMISIPLELASGEAFWVEVRLGEDFYREDFIA